jgi:hypothetical protein
LDPEKKNLASTPALTPPSFTVRDDAVRLSDVTKLGLADQAKILLELSSSCPEICQQILVSISFTLKVIL